MKNKKQNVSKCVFIEFNHNNTHIIASVLLFIGIFA